MSPSRVSGGRWAALALLGVFLLIAGAFLAMVVFGPRGQGAVLVQVDPGLTVQEREGGFDLSGLAGDLALQGRMAVHDERRVDLQLRLANRAGRAVIAAAAPQVLAHMPEHRMPPLPLPVISLGEGVFAAGGGLPMAGTWRLQIAVGDDALGFTLDLRE